MIYIFEMKFLVDAMCGRLTRFLRIFGYDTVYANDLIEHFNLDPIPDEKLQEYAEENQRIIITRDYLFYKKIRDRSVYLKGEGIYNYLSQLKIKLGLNYNFNLKSARCSMCNSTLEKVKDKELIKNEVKEETFNHYDEFFQCKNLNCKKLYWKGSHIDNIIRELKKKVNTS